MNTVNTNLKKNEPVQFKGSMVSCLGFAVLWGFILFVAYYFLRLAFHNLLFIEDIAWRIYFLFPFIPDNSWSGMFFCIFLCFGIGQFIRGRVKVYDNEVHVYGFGKTTRIPLTDFDHLDAKEIHVYIFFIRSFISFWKSHLYYRKGIGLKRCRLYGFDDHTVSALHNQIRVKLTEQLDTAEKIEIADSVKKNISQRQSEFAFDHDSLFAKEASYLRKALLFTVLLAAACVIIMMTENVTMFSELGILAAAFIINIPIQIVLFQKRKKMCPSHIQVISTGLFIDGKYYSFDMIHKIELIRKKDTSVFPTEYYITLRADGKEKYWLGSNKSNSEYPAFCKILQSAMVFCPDKLEYLNRIV